MVTQRPRLLILSFSRIASDARVLKQVHAFADEYDVTTCGYGESPDPRVTHREIPDLPRSGGRRRDLILRRYARLYDEEPAVRGARTALRDAEPFDVVLANDVEAIGVAETVRPSCGVHADLHEYSPRLNEELLTWRVFVAPYMRWLCRTFLPRVRSMTTVGEGIAEEYRRRFGVSGSVVTNAAPYVDQEPSPVGESLRLVHSGAALRNRRLEVTVQAVLESTRPVTLDLYLMPNDPAYLAELRALARGNPRITFHDPVPYQQLVQTLNGYDIGVHVIPPTNFNNRWALPNKLFDYVQARLGILVGPTEEMAAVVSSNQIGVVAAGFDVQAVRDAIERVDSASVRHWKQRSHSSARLLSSAPQIEKWKSAVARLVGHGR